MPISSSASNQAYKITLEANLAEYAAKYGMPFRAAVALFNQLGYLHIFDHITNRKVMF